ncbi:MAG: SWIM zinc finger family protein, partial [Promicromonosporaceae bacterium]|nr:SWIM zinc finger family protein [Promicromonosporaceae bacterium]
MVSSSEVSLAELNRVCGAAAVARGRIYYEAGRVRSYETAGQTTVAQVAGSGSRTYTTWVYNGPRGEFTGGDCSCPVAKNCKHVVATALAASGAVREFAMPIRKVAPEWQKQLDQLLVRAKMAMPREPYQYGHQVEPTQLGLQFRVDGLVKSAARRR